MWETKSRAVLLDKTRRKLWHWVSILNPEMLFLLCSQTHCKRSPASGCIRMISSTHLYNVVPFFLFCFVFRPTMSEVDYTYASDISYEKQLNMLPVQFICSIYLGTTASLHCEVAAFHQCCCNQTKEFCLRTHAHSLTSLPAPDCVQCSPSTLTCN